MEIISFKDFNFILDGVELQRFGEKTFASEKKAKEFLLNFLVMECVTGVIHSNADICRCKEDIEVILKKMISIFLQMNYLICRTLKGTSMIKHTSLSKGIGVLSPQQNLIKIVRFCFFMQIKIL